MKARLLAVVAVCLVGASPAAVEVPADCDVCVVGAGPAGIGAALASAAAGARTVVLERNGFVGGTTVSAEVTDIGLFHAWRKQVIDGPCYRLVTNAMARGNCRLPDVSLQNGDRNWMVGCHKVKPRVYEQAAREALLGAGIDLRLDATVVGAEEAPGGWRLAYRRGGELRALVARCVVDATGNASVAALAGAGRVKSDDATRQPGSYFFWLNTSGMSFDAAALNRAQEEAVRKGELLPTDLYVAASQFVRAGGGWGVYVPLADDSTEELRAETNRRGEEAKARIVGFLRRQPGLADAAVVRSARDVGVRETYRAVGEETITQKDYLSGKLYPDSLCWSFWMIDPHDARAKAAKLIFHENGAVGAVRLGAMIPKGVRGMLVAGRAVSSDHGANSALRVQASCMGMGQVAGVAAALAARQGRDVRRLDLSEVRAALRAMGAIVPPDAAGEGLSLEDGFRSPPDTAKPHLWWHWMNGNVTKEGITADLESMAAVGIGGAQIFDAGCGIPPGPVAFGTPAWYETFAHAAKEADRLGIELCHANCSGWSSSGGPWITADKAMKWLLEPGETPVLKGPCRFSGEVPKPFFFQNRYAGRKVGEYYEDVAVLAVPAPKPRAGTTNLLRLAQWRHKVFLDRKNDCLRDTRIAAPGEAIDKARVIDLTGRFDRRSGRLDWEVPPGDWKVLRIGFASNGQCNFPASRNGIGYEVDKLDEAAVRFHMEQYCEKLVRKLGPYAGNRPSGLNGILIDSYEVGSQNWTGGFEKTFERARGYSLVPYLPLLAGGWVVGSVEESERFLEDFRRVVADEFAKNYCGGLARKCHELRLRLSVEPYGNCPADNLQYGMFCDIPTAECWSHGQLRNHDEGGARRARLGPALRGDGGVHGRADDGRTLDGDAVLDQAAGRPGLRERRQPRRLPPLRPPAVAGAVPAGADHGPLGHALRAVQHVVVRAEGVAEVPGALPVDAPGGALFDGMPHVGVVVNRPHDRRELRVAGGLYSVEHVGQELLPRL